MVKTLLIAAFFSPLVAACGTEEKTVVVDNAVECDCHCDGCECVDGKDCFCETCACKEQPPAEVPNAETDQ